MTQIRVAAIPKKPEHLRGIASLGMALAAHVTEVSREQKLRWFRPAANAGNVAAKINLAQILETIAPDQNALQIAFGLYNDAATAGHPLAHYHLARFMLSGRAGVFNPVAAYTPTSPPPPKLVFP